MNILVTGGAGYIGSHVSLNLLDAGYNVTILDDLSNGHEQLIPQKADFIKCNINNVETINSLLQNNKVIAIMHFAGFVKVEELASLVTWLASEENSFSTAAVFDLSGGRATY